MATITNQWTGNGLPDGTVITTANINTAGNGSTVARGFSGTAEFTTAGNGFRVTASTATDLARVDATLSAASKGVLAQIEFTMGAAHSATASLINLRNTSAGPLFLNYDTSRRVGIADATEAIIASWSPALALGDKARVDLVVTLSATPTTANGRVFFRVRNLTNPTWNTTGEYFYDTGYTRNLGVLDFTGVRFGKLNNYTVATPGLLIEHPGWQAVTVSASDTSEAAAKAYFADAPAAVVPPEPVAPAWRWNGTAYVPLRPYRWGGLAYVPLDVP